MSDIACHLLLEPAVLFFRFFKYAFGLKYCKYEYKSESKDYQ